MGTECSEENKAFTNRAHLAAQKKIYPALLGVPFDQLEFEDTTDGPLDYEMGIDRIVRIKTDPRQIGYPITIQERFRNREWEQKRDITITKMNNATGLPSELYKLQAGLFVYGYFYDDPGQNFGEVIAVNIPVLMMRIATGDIQWTTGENPRSEQPFIALRFNDLRKAKVVVWHRAKNGQIIYPLATRPVDDRLGSIESDIQELSVQMTNLTKTLEALGAEPILYRPNGADNYYTYER